jgi:dTDP-4-dehydrorhamnose reductase
MNVVVVDTAVMDAVDMAVMEEEASLSCNIWYDERFAH